MGEREQFGHMVGITSTQDEVPVEQGDGPKSQPIGDAHGVDRSHSWKIREGRIVVTIDKHDCVRGEYRLHKLGFRFPDLNSNEPIPSAPLG